MRGQSETNHQKDDLPQTWKFTSCIFPTLPPFQCPLERDRPEEGVLLETGRRTYRLEDISGYQESPTHPFCMSMWGRDHEMSVPKQSGYMWADPFRPCHEYEASSLSAFPSVPLEFSWHRCASDVATYVSKLEARRNQGDTSETSDSRQHGIQNPPFAEGPPSGQSTFGSILSSRKMFAPSYVSDLVDFSQLRTFSGEMAAMVSQV